jgi:hypothetical protein
MDFLYLQRGLQSRPCHEILYIYNACAVLCFLYLNPSMEKSPPPPPPPLHSTDNSTFTGFYFVLQVFFKDTLYFLLKYVLPPVLFTLTQVVLLLITSTFTRVQIQSNLGTTGLMLREGTTSSNFGWYACDHSDIKKDFDWINQEGEIEMYQ